MLSIAVTAVVLYTAMFVMTKVDSARTVKAV